jgi:hypothetical protein
MSRIVGGLAAVKVPVSSMGWSAGIMGASRSVGSSSKNIVLMCFIAGAPFSPMIIHYVLRWFSEIFLT